MAKIIAVHGIAQQLQGPHSLARLWKPALRDGVALACGAEVRDPDITVAFYGDLFRPPGKTLGEPMWTAADIALEFEQELLARWWRHAAETDPQVPDPSASTKLRTPNLVQRALYALSHSAFFVGLAERAIIGALKQVTSYLTDESVRAQIQARVTAAVGPDTRLLVGHSLGSVVAYEALCANPAWPVRALVTLGSPLAVPNLIFHRLRPPPTCNQGAWPGSVTRWTNIADRGDVVALVKTLNDSFGDRAFGAAKQVEDVLVDNGAKAHDVAPYLTARETGHAIAAALSL